LRRLVANLVLSLLSILLTLGILEGVMRLVYQPLLGGKEGTPWPQLDDWADYSPPPNRFGHREEEIAGDLLSEEVTRILFHGDSFTFGSRVPRGEDRFSDLLEARLNEQAKGGGGGGRYHIYNAGVRSSNPRHWVKTFDTLLGAYRPDYVFAIFFLRSGTDLQTSLIFHQDILSRIEVKYDGLLYRFSRVYRYFAERMILREFSEYYQRELSRAYLDEEASRNQWQVEKEHLKTLHEKCREAGISFHLIIFPLLYSLEDYPFYAVEEEIVRFAREEGIPVYSLTPGFIGKQAHTLWIAENDQHPNEEGHRVAADTLYPYLEQVVNRPKPPSQEGTGF